MGEQHEKGEGGYDVGRRKNIMKWEAVFNDGSKIKVEATMYEPKTFCFVNEHLLVTHQINPTSMKFMRLLTEEKEE